LLCQYEYLSGSISVSVVSEQEDCKSIIAEESGTL
jgi:hypothetical protein